MDGSVAVLQEGRAHRKSPLTRLLQRHLIETHALLRRSLVLVYAVPAADLEPLLSPQLELDTHDGHGFFVAAMVETEQLRPSFSPFGIDLFLLGYRIFVRYETPNRKSLRGLQVLRSETDSRLLEIFGNLLTRYRYSRMQPEIAGDCSHLQVSLKLHGLEYVGLTANLDVQALPESSLFQSEKEARRFEGPMPFTFSYEPETNSMVRVEGVRRNWNPKLVEVDVRTPPPFEEFGIEADHPRLASAFFVENIPYVWRRGIVDKLR